MHFRNNYNKSSVIFCYFVCLHRQVLLFKKQRDCVAKNVPHQCTRKKIWWVVLLIKFNNLSFFYCSLLKAIIVWCICYVYITPLLLEHYRSLWTLASSTIFLYSWRYLDTAKHPSGWNFSCIVFSTNLFLQDWDINPMPNPQPGGPGCLS
jgi:hypothetical protein